MSSLSTHVLDTASGRPASGVRYTLYRVGADLEFVCTGETNSDGRPDAALLAPEQFESGEYELRYSVGEYFTGKNANSQVPPFLDEVIVRFRLITGERYHIPLLVSPWSYSVYRGS